MNTIQSTLCLILGSLLPLAALFFFARRGMRQLQVAAAYREVSRQLGLDVDTRGLSLQGHLGDRRIWIGEVMVGHGPERRMMTWGVLDLTRPLGLGLLVRREGRTTRILRRAPSPDAPIGDPDLDRVLQVQGDEPDRVHALFTPTVRQSLRTLMDSWPEVAITDRAVRVHLTKPESSTGGLQLLVASMLGLAEDLEEARKRVDAPRRLSAEVPLWEALGARYHLTVEPWLPALHGEVQGYRILVGTRRVSEGYRAMIRLWFKPHEKTGLRLRRQREPDGYWSVGQDIQVGDGTFDSSFVIKGWDPEHIVGMLDEPTRAAMLGLSETGDPELDDHCLYVEGIAMDQEVIARSIEYAAKVAAALHW